MSYHPPRILTPVESRKRKEREFTSSSTAEVTTKPKPSAPMATAAARLKGVEPALDNRLLAGYMAYEFLTKWTLFGQRFNPARAELGRAGASAAAEPKRPKLESEPSGLKEHEGYAEVASILKTEGAHIPGIVNPTQLARWIQM